MLTLNQISRKLIDWFDDHAQINEVVYKDDFEFSADRTLEYPVANIQYVNARINNNVLNYNFKFLLGSLVSEDDTKKQDDVVSDMLLIAEDFFSYLQYQEGLIFSKSSSIEKFWDDTGDRISGIIFTVTLSVVRSQNDCWTPTVL